MRELYKSGNNPQQKLVAVNNKFGNTDIKFQQGTSRTIYDTLPWTVDGESFRFFEDSASRNFPFSNTGSDGNKLGVGETLVVSDIIFSVLTYDPINNRYTNIAPITQTPGGSFSLLNFEIGNNRVIKDYSITSGSPIYAKTVGSVSSVIDLDTDIVIPPLLQFIASLRTAKDGTAPAANTFIRCTIHGAAGILAPRTTF
jgi:hypothetical protein